MAISSCSCMARSSIHPGSPLGLWNTKGKLLLTRSGEIACLNHSYVIANRKKASLFCDSSSFTGP